MDPDLSADFKAIHAREHQIQNNQIKLLLQRTPQPFISFIFNLYFKAGQLQIILLQICDRDLIFYDQNSAHFTGTS